MTAHRCEACGKALPSNPTIVHHPDGTRYYCAPPWTPIDDGDKALLCAPLADLASFGGWICGIRYLPSWDVRCR